MNVLIACEESQRICIEFRKRGHNAFSCDIQSCSGEHPEWHILGDVTPLINGNCAFYTQDTRHHNINTKWDLIIAHPPCTYLSTAATRSHSLKSKTLEQIAERTWKRIDAMTFFMQFVNADCDKIAIENPQGVMSACYRQPDQYIHPWYFATDSNDVDNYVTKKTGLWLKGLKPLEYSTNLDDPMKNAPTWSNGKKKCWTESHSGSVERSKTFPGIAKAMAEQWG